MASRLIFIFYITLRNTGDIKKALSLRLKPQILQILKAQRKRKKTEKTENYLISEFVYVVYSFFFMLIVYVLFLLLGMSPVLQYDLAGKIQRYSEI